MTGALYHLGRLSVRRRWLVLSIWLLVFAAPSGRPGCARVTTGGP